ncbi:MAG: hypothetical protein AB1763_10740 [Campylobacterota bacterium]
MKTTTHDRIEKEMSEIYRAFLEREKAKKRKVQALISDYANKAAELEGQKQFKALVADFRDKVLKIYEYDPKVQTCS